MSNTNLQTQTSNALHNVIMEAGGKDRPPMLAPDNYVKWKSRIKRYINTKPNNELIHYCLQNPPYKFKWTEKTVLVAEAKAIQIILTRIDNDIYSIVDACPNACKMWKAIKRLKQCESINVQDLETNLYWEFGKFTSRDGESLESYYLSSYFNYNQNDKVNEIRAERLARTANPLALVAQQQPVYHPQNHPNHNTQYSSTRSQQPTRIRGKAIVNSSAPIYDQEPATVTEDDEMSKEKEIDKLMALISLSFKKIYKPPTTTFELIKHQSEQYKIILHELTEELVNNQRAINVAGARENVGTPVVQKSGIQCYNCKEYGHVSRECQKPKRVKDAAYHKEKITELEQHYMYMAQLQVQEVTPDPVDNSGPIFDDEPMHKVQNNNENYNVFAMENKHPEQPESSNDIYLAEHGNTNITIDSLDICYDRVQDDQDEADDLDQEREIKDFKTKNKSLESSNNHFKEANNELSKTNQLMFKDLKKFQAELDKYNDVNYASKVEIDCAKAKGDLMSYKIDFEKSSNAYTQQINDLNQTISDMKKEVYAHQETISIMSQAKEA
ncbi:gag-pol polyprotein [Tanacetum coccineum]